MPPIRGASGWMMSADAVLDQRDVLGDAGQHLAGRDRRVQRGGELAWPSASYASSGSSIQTRSNCSSTRPNRSAVGRSHCWLASTISGTSSPRCSRTAGTRGQVDPVVGLADLDLDPADPLGQRLSPLP